MSRSRFMLSPAPGGAAGAAGAAVPARPRPATRERSAAAAGRGRRPSPVLALTAAPGPGQGETLAGAVLVRALTARPRMRAVVLELTAEEIEPGACQALGKLHEKLRACGVTLRLAAAAPQVRAGLRDAGLTCVGRARVIHPTLRAAVLAAYATLPGAGLVTGPVRMALTTPAEPLAVIAPAASPAEDGAHPGL